MYSKPRNTRVLEGIFKGTENRRLVVVFVFQERTQI